MKKLLKVTVSMLNYWFGRLRCRRNGAPDRFLSFVRLLTLPFMLAATAVFALGCGNREKPPSYNRLRNQIVIEMFQALRDENPVPALNQLDRIKAFAENPAFADVLTLHEQQRLLINNVNRHLGNADIAAARAEVAGYSRARAYDGGDVSGEITLLLAELKLLDDYLRHKRDADAATVRAALQTLLDEIELITDSRELQQWLSRQYTLIEEAERAEVKHKVGLILGTLPIIDPVLTDYQLPAPIEAVERINKLMATGLYRGTNSHSEMSNDHYIP